VIGNRPLAQKDGVLRRVLDDRGRLFGKVNIVDLVVLVVIVAIVVFAAVRLTGDGAVATEPIKLTLVDYRVDAAVAAGMQTKGKVTDTAGNVIGEIQSIQVTPTKEELLTNDGQLKVFTSATKHDITYLVLCQGTVTDSTAHVGAVATRIGTDLRIVGPGYEAQTVIIGVVWGPEALK
jgi:hypothetical protein